MIRVNVVHLDESVDGWVAVHMCGTTLYELWDNGEFVIRCTKTFRDNILKASNLPLKMVENHTSLGNLMKNCGNL